MTHLEPVALVNPKSSSCFKWRISSGARSKESITLGRYDEIECHYDVCDPLVCRSAFHSFLIETSFEFSASASEIQ